MANTHIISLNCKGLRDKLKRLRLLEWLNHQHCQIVFLQETHFTSDISVNLNTEFSDWIFYHSLDFNRLTNDF